MAGFALLAAFLVTDVVVVLDQATFATGDYSPIMRKAIGFALAGLVLIVVSWRGLSWLTKSCAVLLGVVNLLALADATWRLLAS